MATQRIIFKREKEDGKETVWRLGAMEYGAEEIVITGKGIGNNWEGRFRPNELQTFRIVEIADTASLAAMYGGGIAGWIAAAVMAKRVTIPVVELVDSMATAGNRRVQIRVPGNIQVRKRMKDFAFAMRDYVTARGYTGDTSELSRPEQWEPNTQAFLSGCLLVFVIAGVLVGAVFACIFLATGLQ